jgi:hypothetical protein
MNFSILRQQWIFDFAVLLLLRNHPHIYLVGQKKTIYNLSKGSQLLTGIQTVCKSNILALSHSTQVTGYLVYCYFNQVGHYYNIYILNDILDIWLHSSTFNRDGGLLCFHTAEWFHIQVMQPSLGSTARWATIYSYFCTKQHYGKSMVGQMTASLHLLSSYLAVFILP